MFQAMIGTDLTAKEKLHLDCSTTIASIRMQMKVTPLLCSINLASTDTDLVRMDWIKGGKSILRSIFCLVPPVTSWAKTSSVMFFSSECLQLWIKGHRDMTGPDARSSCRTLIDLFEAGRLLILSPLKKK